jgi:uncharacterized protein YdaU (DUF1376 family)
MNFLIIDTYDAECNARNTSLEEYGIFITLIKLYFNQEVYLTEDDIKKFITTYQAKSETVMRVLNNFFVRRKYGWIHTKTQKLIKNNHEKWLRKNPTKNTKIKLTKKDVRRIKAHLYLGANYGNLARNVGVSPMCIKRIADNKTWRNV